MVWRHEDVFYALGGGIDPPPHPGAPPGGDGGRAAAPLTHLPIAPLMHGATQWSVLGQSFVGSKTVLIARFDPVAGLAPGRRGEGQHRDDDRRRHGQAHGRGARGSCGRLRLSSLLALVSSAAIFSPPVKDQFFACLPHIIITDAVGSSETGNNGFTIITAGQTAMKSGPTVVSLGETVVLDDELRPVAPGSGVIGRIARSGDIPLGYYNDPVKTAEVFFTVDGRRYVMPGDFATVEADGSLTLLGRGSVVINSGGEKIFPEEVESAVRAHPDVIDAIVVGAPDERWGQTVAAIVAPRPGRRPPSRASRTTAGRPSPATRCPAASTRSRPSCGPRAASPTTGGPRPS